ncbi:HK97 gp10 family phage protein [uncultured Sphingobium sp.]|uniref:HK97 gp10 family phage protein n=1 Tax=uncultured Sphingobium sp. TaxID=316087 RepID=UPI00259BEBB6|nr:HK97 gp10 family phage protein [uncultured Sphingobium sp.]
MKSGFRIEGFEDADRNLTRLSDMTDADQLKAIGINALQPVADTAKALVRRRTGALANSIHAGDQLSRAQAARHAPEPGTVEIYVGPGPLPQAITEEFGTVYEGAHPFLRPSWDGRLREVQSRLRAALGDRLTRILRG